ncbi:hypothetical protein [Pseudomonas cichorii]|uniref:Uncharacterized protein n=1 Tax=Pseudomonas cichorii TaxID=36746 RepID=A0ABQ1DSY0_PSECI|nr:hypothetical protein [Pseudomonas cichorii]AHF66071.1 hypothetical protein PCH70_09180 [Pseudomonas cichorii JBC1]QVE18035.1 hypothetical protein KGD89_04560 [Pseudomonas cichorii]GFM94109.1 hypothetical protein PSCICP_40810 [Pseudomonas cichorii]SDO98679.1 hypothetical protein SAMN05216599_11670 [Pseudomonas cichorii]
MGLFQSLFNLRRPLRHYALVDKNGICRALKHCTERPLSSDWVEVNEQRANWLNQPLPSSARVAPHGVRPAPHQLITA